ncbi:hypothetical protein AAA088_14845 [Hominifimenecus microfluidus]
MSTGTCSDATLRSPRYSFLFIWYRRFIALTFGIRRFRRIRRIQSGGKLPECDPLLSDLLM